MTRLEDELRAAAAELHQATADVDPDAAMAGVLDRSGRRSRGPLFAGAAAVVAALVMGVGLWWQDDRDDVVADRVDEPTPTTPETSTTQVTTTTAPEWSGPPMLVVVDRAGNLMAIDLVDGSRSRQLVDPAELASSLGVSSGTIDGVDLSPDGMAAFTFNGREGDRLVPSLFEVPVDGSGEPERIDLAGTGYLLEPEYSPSGRLFAVYTGAELVVVPVDGGAPASPGVPLGYTPTRLLWSPAGDRLMWVPAYGRGSPCCPYVSVPVDPVTGELASEASEGTLPGLPYFDTKGEVRGQRNWSYQEIDVDASGRHAVTAATGTTGLVLESWDPDDPDGDRHPLDLNLDLPPFGPVHVAW